MTHALKICEHLIGALNSQNGTKLKLHSIYGSAANYKTVDGRIVTFLSSQRPMAVASISLPADNIREYFSGTEVLTIFNSLLIGESAVIDLSNSEIISPYIRSYSNLNRKADLASQLKSVLITNIPEKGIYKEIAKVKILNLPEVPGATSSSKYPERFGKLMESILHNADFNTLDGLFKGIIGYGIGLTPSADDFVLGLLAVYSSRDPVFKNLAQACKANIYRTNDISGEMLFHGSEKRFCKPIIELFESPDISSAAASLLNVGYSSGHDILCGIYAGLVLLCKD
ncbi:MAG: Protein of uncharacterized function [Clostridiales bacterium]|nr:Protein of uncharacterized function [Clostridiales bacterium]